MTTPEQRRVSDFRDEAARRHYEHVLGSLLADWPPSVRVDVVTTFGTTVTETVNLDGPGTPLVLLHGAQSSLACWNPVIRGWSGSRPVVAIETMGDAGRGSQRNCVKDGGDAASWLIETLDRLGLRRVHLLGFSYGGWQALDFAARHPERVASLVALDPARAIAGMRAYAWWRILRMTVGGRRTKEKYFAWMQGGKAHSAAQLDLLMTARTRFAQRGAPLPQRLTATQWQALTGPPVPMMVVLGGASPIMPARTPGALTRQAPHAELHILPGASHELPAERPHDVVDLVNAFLDRQETRR